MNVLLPRPWLLVGLVFILGVMPLVGAQEPELPERDVLAYPDGDRVQGRFIRQADGFIFFHSDRFGELKVPVGKAVVIKAVRSHQAASATPAAAPVEPAPAPVASAAPNETEKSTAAGPSQWLSPALLTAKLREFFNPWSGRFALSTETLSNTAEQSLYSMELSLRRKWKRDEVQLKGRYDFSQTNERTITDMLKADGLWRHDLKKKGFALYRPSLEWNQAAYRGGVPSDYVLLQQEVGAGWNVYASEKYKLRLGASENLFDIWSINLGDAHSSRTAESAFIEAELKLPWSILLTERGVVYYSFNSGEQGSENRIELTKKFSETLSAAVRHEVRRGSPEQRAQDYSRLKLLLGVDF